MTMLASVYESLARRLPHAPPRRFGLYEAAKYLRHGSFDWILRHLLVISELEAFRKETGRPTVRVLDFGGGDASLARAIRMYGLEHHYAVVLVDVDAQAVDAADRRSPLVEAQVINAEPPLPLGADAVDVVVSSDVFEHIPRQSRKAWADELQRVGAHRQIHTVPCDEPQSGYVSLAADSAFANWHAARFLGPERWTAEHLELVPPSLTELHDLFPGSSIRGTINARVWLTIMKNDFASRSRWHQARNALWHPVIYRLRGTAAPYKGCLIVQGAA